MQTHSPLSTRPGSQAGGPRELVGFRVGGQAFCIDIGSVLEIRGWSPTTPLPQAPAYMKGVVNLRGAVLPIIDLAARLGLPTSEPSARHAIVVVQSAGRTLGLLVEGVSEILQLDEDLLQPAPDLGETGQNPVVGVYALDAGMISLLAIDAILPPSAATH